MASGFMAFLIVLVGLCIIVGMIFIALDYIARDEFLKKMGKLAVGGCAVLVLLYQLKALFFGGGGGGGISPVAMIEFAIGVIVLVVVFYLVNLVIGRFLSEPFLTPVNYVICALMLIILLVLAEQALFGGGLGLISNTGSFRLK
jgi:hypothetical protein